MAFDLNKVMVIGRLTQDPELRTTPTGQSVATFSVATNRSWKDTQGQIKNQVEYHNVVAWRRTAETVKQYLTKGKQVYVEGYLQTRSWVGTQDNVKRYRTEIIADNVIFLGSPTGTSNYAPAAQPVAFAQNDMNTPTPPQPSANIPETPAAPVAPAQAPAEEEIRIEDIPF